ncbi:hypothetical protein N7532_008701 [Penicillium argentinense]|uniref:Uncharacterized protein n=1 Tax=Penicillium argentinense TaxID=1131581 RepID=A0A9W9K2S4_9EURO|nr:uncharacterized protein N7532_008701 [Penicillium argentinense]KAJ5090017.1 hypothetical protein N7532_008701 [Penicillium argentinense]
MAIDPYRQRYTPASIKKSQVLKDFFAFPFVSSFWPNLPPSLGPLPQGGFAFDLSQIREKGKAKGRPETDRYEKSRHDRNTQQIHRRTVDTLSAKSGAPRKRQDPRVEQAGQWRQEYMWDTGVRPITRGERQVPRA